jgi:hypothetical protein
MKVAIFDIDGTLAEISHRHHWVKNKPKNWKAFNAAMHLDGVHNDVVDMLKILSESYVILLASGRGEESRDVTVNWLNNVAGIKGLYNKLYMRPLKDNRSDVIVKSEILDQILKDGFEPVMVFDDRQGVVDMWRSRGIRTYQVAPGDF